MVTPAEVDSEPAPEPASPVEVITGDEGAPRRRESGATEMPVITTLLAAETLASVFGALLEEDYLTGKTELRDALCDRFELSQLEAEEMCDQLERAELIRFVSSPEGQGWHIHLEPGPESG